uniref:Uncharacterized protein n=1 Tax=Sphaerodactylus townsendi TaxID=933632 RepID=A0ACB8EZZ7_9SAUR
MEGNKANGEDKQSDSDHLYGFGLHHSALEGGFAYFGNVSPQLNVGSQGNAKRQKKTKEHPENCVEQEDIGQLIFVGDRLGTVMNYGLVAVDTDEHQEIDAAIEVGAKHEGLELAEELPKGPVIFKTEIGHHQRGDGKDTSIHQRKVELQHDAGVPVLESEPEDPQTDAVEDQAAHG